MRVVVGICGVPLSASTREDTAGFVMPEANRLQHLPSAGHSKDRQVTLGNEELHLHRIPTNEVLLHGLAAGAAVAVIAALREVVLHVALPLIVRIQELKTHQVPCLVRSLPFPMTM